LLLPVTTAERGADIWRRCVTDTLSQTGLSLIREAINLKLIHAGTVSKGKTILAVIACDKMYNPGPLWAFCSSIRKISCAFIAMFYC
jgi:hypothetical protein